MPIAVVCSGCQARFTVSDQFAGKKGPCPKCKAIITIPTSSAAGSNGSAAPATGKPAPAKTGPAKAGGAAASPPAANRAPAGTNPQKGAIPAAVPPGSKPAAPARGATSPKAPAGGAAGAAAAKGAAPAAGKAGPAPAGKGATPAGKGGAAPPAKPGGAAGAANNPAAKQPAAPIEVKIHAPEEYQTAGKGLGGRSISKPLRRKETKLDRMTTIIGVAVALVIVILAVLLRGVVAANPIPYLAVGLLIVSPPLVRMGYGFLRDDELEAYTGRPLWIRTAICTAAYIGLWAFYGFVLVPNGMTGEMWQWLFVAPLIVAFGGLVAFAAFDLEPGSAAMHYGFYLLVTLVLRALIGLQPVWEAALTTATA